MLVANVSAKHKTRWQVYHTDISTTCSQRSLNVSVTLTWTAVTATSSALTNNGPLRVLLLPPWQTSPFITALPDLSAPAPRSDSHTDHPSCRQKPDSAPGTETLTERLGVVRAFHRDLHKKFLLRWPICTALQGEEGDGQEYLVTVINTCYWSEWKANATRHNWTIIYARLWQTEAW